MQEIAKAISNMPKSNEKKRIVIITQGANPVIMANGKFGLFITDKQYMY